MFYYSNSINISKDLSYLVFESFLVLEDSLSIVLYYYRYSANIYIVL